MGRDERREEHDTGERRGAILVLPSSVAGQQGPVAAWVSTAGWAAAARRVLGHSWIVTPGGLVDPDGARSKGSSPALSAATARSWRRSIPEPVKTVVKDVRQWQRARRFRVDAAGPWRGYEVEFVWQRHELFQTAGLDFARALGVPSVLFVPATLIWEARQWGVHRPGRRGWLERHGERPALLRADLVACGSDLVVEQVQRLGATEDRILVTPTGADLDLFTTRRDPEPLRRRLGLDRRFVVGWVGSFRRFHALETAVEAMIGLEDAVLLLVGDGPERPRIEQIAGRRGVEIVTTGTVPHGELPDYLALMDVAVVVAPHDEPFHYSPLKLAEYLAAGLPVVAPRVSQLSDRLRDGVDALLVPPGDTAALAGALERLRAEPQLREALASRARTAAEAEWSWDEQVRRVVAALAAVGRRSGGRTNAG